MKKQISILILLLIASVAFSQKKKKDTIGTEVINVVKPYTPTVSDAFKIKSSPEINDSKISKKKQIEYAIFSIPVASTFTPAKGKAKVLRVDPSAPVYDNFITAGFGNFSTPQVEVFAHTNSTRYNDFGGFLNYHSSKGGIDGVVLNDDFVDTRLDLFYKQEDRDFDWQLNGGLRFQKYNWYGLPEQINFSQNVIDGLAETQKYTNVYVGGKLDYKDSFFQGGTTELNYFTDDEGSTEAHILIQPKIEFPIASEYINANARLEYLKGDFFQNYDGTGNIDYSFFTIGFNPNFEVLRDNLTINLGADILYSSGSADGEESKIYMYPKVTASYILIDQVLTVYAGALGGLHQNTYNSFANENPFVSPTLNIKRTDEQYNAFVGFKGKLASNVGYNFKGFYRSEKDKPLYKLNPTKTEGNIIVTKGYEAGNSFQVLYDNIKTLGGFAEISVDFSAALKFGGNIEVNSYNIDNQAETWNLPALKASAFANYNQDKWFAGANLFFVGERKDELTFQTPVLTTIDEVLTLGNYVDLNLNGGYKFTDKLTAFIKVNNVFSSSYQKYANFNVQGLQVFGGLTYKFDL
ncbi:MAG: TonB-dependent receptor [Flavobacteriaceae bacterium]|nr:TonB-dependent receptor [Flavobacteriaceae bacterium]